MIYFTKKLHTYYGYSEFIFNRTVASEAPRYHVSVRHGEGRALLFTMEGAGDAWRITDTTQVPDWVRESEKLLSEEIARRSASL